MNVKGREGGMGRGDGEREGLMSDKEDGYKEEEEEEWRGRGRGWKIDGERRERGIKERGE